VHENVRDELNLRIIIDKLFPTEKDPAKPLKN
jgi:hypothetical protein